MRTAKIGPDLRLRVCQKNLTLPELPIFKPWVTNNVTIVGFRLFYCVESSKHWKAYMLIV